MPSENKNLEEIKENESNISGGVWYKPWTWGKRTNAEGQIENLLAQNPDSSPENPEDTKTHAANRPSSRRRR